MRSLALPSELLLLGLLSALMVTTNVLVKAEQQLVPDWFPELPVGHPGGHPYPKLLNAFEEEDAEGMEDEYENWIKRIAEANDNDNNNNNKMLRLEKNEETPPEKKRPLFFFGNSFTSFNVFPAQVRDMYSQALGLSKKERPDVPRRSKGGSTIANHYLWLNNLVDDQDNKLYDDGSFGADKEWIVVQDQSAVPAIPDWRMSNNFYWERMLNFFAKNDTIVLWQTWGYRYGFDNEGVRYETFPEMNAALLEGYLQYFNIARSKGYSDTWLAPCGLTFETIYQDCLAKGLDKEDDKCMWNKLYDRDGYHPGGPGSYACAMTIVSTMTGFNPFDVGYLHPSVEGQLVDGQPMDLVIKDAVSRTIRSTYLSGLLDYPFDELWDHPAPEDIWIAAAPAAPTDPPSPAPTGTPTSVPTPEFPTTASPTASPTTGAPSTSPTEAHEFNVVFMGTKDYLANDNTRDMFNIAFSELVDVDDSGPIRIGLNQIENFDSAGYGLPLAFDRVTVDWIVLQENLDHSSVPFGLDYDPAGRATYLYEQSVAGSIDLHKNLVGSIGAKTMMLMPLGGMEGYTSDLTNATFDNFLDHTNSLWNAYSNYLWRNSGAGHNFTATSSAFPNGTKPFEPAYLAPAGMVAKTIYEDLIAEGTDPLEEGTLFRQLYAADGITPSDAGQYLIGMTLAVTMTGWDPTSPMGEYLTGKLPISEGTMEQIRDVVGRTIAGMLGRPLEYPWGVEWTTRAPVAPVAVQSIPQLSGSSNGGTIGIAGAPAPAPTYASIGSAPAPTYASIGAASKSAQVDVTQKEKLAVPNSAEEEPVGLESGSKVESPDVGEVLGFSSASGIRFWQSMLLVGQAAFAWILLL